MKSITNDEMVLELTRFYLAYNEQPEYQEFYTYRNSILKACWLKQSHGLIEFTPSGYEEVIEAYNALAELGYFDEDKDPFEKLFEDNE